MPGTHGYISDTKSWVGFLPEVDGDLPHFDESFFLGNEIQRAEDAEATLAAVTVATYLPRRNHLAPSRDRLVSLALSGNTYTRVDMGVYAMSHDPTVDRIYGVSQVNGHWQTSDDHGATWTDRTFSPSSAVPVGIGGSVVAMWTDAASGFMYVIGPGGSVFRAALGVYNAWTDITPSGVPANTIGRPEVLYVFGGALYYGNYGTAGVYAGTSTPGSFIWRSTDHGATWTVVLNVSAARHVHAIRGDAVSGDLYLMLGDQGSTYAHVGLYKSIDNGVTWVKMNPDVITCRYGINMIFPTAVPGVPRQFISEGDGKDIAFLYSWPVDYVAGDELEAALFPDNSAPGGAWRGTVRGAALTTEQNIIFISTSENGALGLRDGVWLARAPYYTGAVLLEEITGATWSYYRTIVSGGFALNGQMRMQLPMFLGQ